jgi:hypothetical protein
MWFAKLFGGREDDSEPSEHPPHPAASAMKEAPANVRSVTSKVVLKPKQVARKGFDPYNSGSFNKNKAWDRVIR